MLEYEPGTPLNLYLKEAFRREKSWGSKDRKFYREAVYAWFRLGFIGKSWPNAARLAAALRFRGFEHPILEESLLQVPDEEWRNALQTKLPWKEWCNTYPILAQELFPIECLSKQIQPQLWLADAFSRKPVWVFPRKGDAKLWDEAKNDPLEIIESTIAKGFPAESNWPEKWVKEGKARIQDLGSSQTLELLNDLPKLHRIWDCCCGAGGKSLALAEQFPEAHHYASDRRTASLGALKERFHQYRFNAPFTAEIDLVKGEIPTEWDKMDLIVADVPCSGSGTWNRSPEGLYGFEEQVPHTYAGVQRSIVRKAITKLRKGGYLLYITCSVLAEENEENVVKLQEELGLQLIKQRTIEGYMQDSDSFFAALLQIPV